MDNTNSESIKLSRLTKENVMYSISTENTNDSIVDDKIVS
jgi:hypothetical protein